MTAINTYLRFNGNCEEAFNFYSNVFGNDPMFDRYGADPNAENMPEEAKNLIMHVSLPIGENGVLMGSDMYPGMDAAIIGNNFSISLLPTTEEETTRLFNALSAGGQVTMPLEKTFWNATFGMFIDKFGINWMINFQQGDE